MMGFLFKMLQFGVAWFVGNFVAMTISQIGCCLCCSFPLLRRLKPYSDCINISRAKGMYRKAIIVNSVILALASWAVVAFAPLMMRYGFFFSLAFTTIIGMGKWGCNETNVEEFVQNLQKYVVPGKDDEAFLALAKVIYGK